MECDDNLKQRTFMRAKLDAIFGTFKSARAQLSKLPVFTEGVMTRPRTTTRKRRRTKPKSKRDVTLASEQPNQVPIIDRALIIYSEPLKWILSGKKILEIRSKATRVRGLIALLEKGTKKILGTSKLTDCLGPLTVDEFIANAPKMNATRRELEDDREGLEEDAAYGLYAWVLEDTKRLAKPIRFQNPSGAVIWVRLPPRVSDRLSLPTL